MMVQMTGEEIEEFQKEFNDIISKDFQNFATLKKTEALENGKNILDLIELATKGFVERAFHTIKYRRNN